MLVLMSTPFSLAYTCACGCVSAYAYAPVKTRLTDLEAQTAKCGPNRLYFNYCLVENSEIQIKLIERKNVLVRVRENLNRCAVIESIISEWE